MGLLNRVLHTDSGPGSVRLPFVHGAVRMVPVFGSDASCGKRSLCFLSVLTEEHGSSSSVKSPGVGGGGQTLIFASSKSVWRSKSRGFHWSI